MQDALEKLDGVEKAVASHPDKRVEVEMSRQVDSAEIQRAIEEAGYKFIGEL